MIRAIQKARENKVVSSCVAIAALMVMFTGTWAGIGLMDDLHTTKAELFLYDLKAHTFASQQFDALTQQIGNTEVTGKCRLGPALLPPLRRHAGGR